MDILLVEDLLHDIGWTVCAKPASTFHGARQAHLAPIVTVYDSWRVRSPSWPARTASHPRTSTKQQRPSPALIAASRLARTYELLGFGRLLVMGLRRSSSVSKGARWPSCRAADGGG